MGHIAGPDLALLGILSRGIVGVGILNGLLSVGIADDNVPFALIASALLAADVTGKYTEGSVLPSTPLSTPTNSA